MNFVGIYSHSLFLSAICVLGTQKTVMSNVQKVIKGTYWNALKNKQVPDTEMPDTVQPDFEEELVQSETNFQSLLSTIVWFLEHDLYADVTMNLDVNY